MKRNVTSAALCLRRLVEDESGQDLIEYALVAALVGLGAVASPAQSEHETCGGLCSGDDFHEQRRLDNKKGSNPSHGLTWERIAAVAGWTSATRASDRPH